MRREQSIITAIYDYNLYTIRSSISLWIAIIMYVHRKTLIQLVLTRNQAFLDRTMKMQKHNTSAARLLAVLIGRADSTDTIKRPTAAQNRSV